MLKFILLSFLLSSTLFSYDSNKEVYFFINLGATQASITSQSGIESDTENGFNIEFGATRVWNSGVLASFSMEYGHVSILDQDINTFGGDIKLGYQYKDFSAFVIGSGIYQSLDTNDAAGFGYGAGFEYIPFDHVGLGVEYKTYNMTSNYFEYDFNVAKAYLKILF